MDSYPVGSSLSLVSMAASSPDSAWHDQNCRVIFSERHMQLYATRASGGVFPGERMVNCRWFATDTEGLPNFSPEWQDVGVGGARLEVCQVLNKI